MARVKRGFYDWFWLLKLTPRGLKHRVVALPAVAADCLFLYITSYDPSTLQLNGKMFCLYPSCGGWWRRLCSVGFLGIRHGGFKLIANCRFDVRVGSGMRPSTSGICRSRFFIKAVMLTLLGCAAMCSPLPS